MAAQPMDPSVQAILLQESQNEIAALRTELYSTRRAAEERRQASEKAAAAKAQLEAENATLQQNLAARIADSQRLQALQTELAQLQEAHRKLTQEQQISAQARKILSQELDDERRARQAAEEARSRLEVDKSRLSKAREDLAMQLRMAEQRAREAQEEQIRAEEESAALRAELAGRPVRTSFDEGQRGGGKLPASASLMSEDAAILLQQLEAERDRSAVTLSSLGAAQAEVARLQEQLDTAQQQQGGEASHLRAELASLRQQLAATEARAASLGASLSKAQEQHAAAEAQLQATTAQLQSTGSQLHATQAQLLVAQQAAAAARERRQSGSGASAPQPRPPQLPMPMPRGALQQDGGCAAVGGEGELPRMAARVTALQKSRNKLLEELDEAAGEIERLMTENKVLLEDVAAARELAERWEAQAQGHLAQLDQLKDMVAASAAWGSGAAGDGEAAAAAADLHAALLKEQARSADLDLQVRALAAELTRSHAAGLDVGRSFLPLLVDFEGRVGAVCKKIASAQEL